MRASFVVCFALAGLVAACTPSPDDGIHGVPMDGGSGELGACALGGCMHGLGPDLGMDGAAPIDDGAIDSGVVCEVPSTTNRVSPVTGQSMSLPFVVQTVWADWNSSPTCTAPMLHIALSDSTFCGDPAAQQIDIYFPTSPALAPTTTSYVLSSVAAQSILVYYRPPTTVPSMDQGQVGPCAMPGSMITFDSLQWPPMAGKVTGTLTSADLYPCASSTTPPTPVWTVDATFDVAVPVPAPTCAPGP